MKERFYLFFNKEEIEILRKSLDILKDLNNLPEKNEILDNLINKIYESIQSHLDEDLINRKEFSNKDYFDPMYNELISLFNKAKEPITISINENIKYANSAFCKMLGYESENEILELGLFNMISKRSLPIIKNFYKKRLKGEIVPNIHDLELKRADGSTILIECIHYCMPFKGLNLMINFYIGLTKLKSLEKKLRESEEKFRTLTYNIPGMIYRGAQDWSIEFITNCVSICGYSTDEFICQKVNWIDIIHPDDKGEVVNEGNLMAKRPMELSQIYRIITKDGIIRWVNDRKFSVFTENGIFKGVDGIVYDITEKKKAEDRLRLHSEIMTNMAEGVYIIRTNDGIITYTNPKFEKMFGYKHGEMIGKNVSIVNAPTDKRPEETAKEITEILERTGEWHGEVKNIKKDGTPFWCYANVSTFDHPENGRVWVSVHADITERKKSEQKLKESEEKYRNAYNQANFYKDLFAHDMNNMLNNIGTSEELISIYLNNPDEFYDIKKCLNIIKEQVLRGSELISNVQKLSQLEESEISLESVEFCKVLKDAIQFTHKSFQTRKISIQIDSIGKKLFVQANDLLLDVFENILNNAVKFNDNPQIEILIRISKIQKKGIKYLKIEFVDKGIGIPDDRKDTIFQRASEKDESVRGMGLGLSLVKKIIEIYKGEIWIEDKVKGDYTKGSNFVLLIPEVV